MSEDINTQNFPDSPFEPWRPVSPDKFKGRKKDIQKIKRYMPRVKNQGTPEHFFIIGKRGMGKTSFIKYVSQELEENFQMIPIHINNGGGKTIDKLIEKLLEELLREFKKDYLGKSIIDKILNNVKEFKVAGTGVSLKDNTNLITNIKKHFADFLITTCEELPKGYGIFIVIDDLNGLSDNEEFTNWYKGFFETLTFNEYHLPIVFTLISYPDEFEKLCLINESFSRMFHLIEIDNLEDEDIEDFFKTSFNNVGIEFEDYYKSITPMIYFSWGMPLIMQQIGDSIFWNAQENLKINEEIVSLGIVDATEELGKKQLKSKLNKIRSDTYIDIFLKLADKRLITFKKSNVKTILTDDENRVFNDFLKRSRELGIIESIGRDNSGEYGFVNILYFTYFMMLSESHKLETGKKIRLK